MDGYTNSIQDKDIITDYRKDQLSVMEEGHEQSQPRFDVDEPLEVQLRFDLSLVDTQMLLDSHDNRDSHWDFMRQEQSGLAFHPPSEENVAITEHSMKQNDYKSYDHCEQWTRSSVDEVDAHLYMDTQVDVSMISDTFEAKGRDERVGPGGDQDEANTLLDLSAKEHTEEKPLDKRIPENDTSFQVNEKMESKSSRNCAADCDGDTLSKDNNETDACTLKDQRPEEGETVMVMCKTSTGEESKSEAIEAGTFTHLKTKMAMESLVTTNDTANEARVEAVSTSNDALSVGKRSLEEPYAECLEKQPSMERQTPKSGQKDQAQSFDGLPHWEDKTSEDVSTEEHPPNQMGLSSQTGDAVTARERASVVSIVGAIGFLPGSHLTSSAVGDCAVDRFSGKDLVSKQGPDQIDSSTGNVTANVARSPGSQAASEEVSTSFEVKNEAEKQKQPVITDKPMEAGKGLSVPAMRTEISLGTKGQMAQVAEHETRLLEGDSRRHVQMGLLSQSSRADSPQEGDGSKISCLVKIMNEKDVVSSSEDLKSLNMMVPESIKEKQVSDSQCPGNEVMPRDDPQTIGLDMRDCASPHKEQISIVPAVSESQSRGCQVDSHLVLKGANETQMTMDEGKLLGHTELAAMDRGAFSCQTHTHLTEAATTQQSDSLVTCVDGRCEVSSVASMTLECAEFKSSGLSVSESRSCASEFGAACVSMEKEKSEAVSLNDLKNEVGESHVSDTPMSGEVLNIANGPADLEREASAESVENLRKDMEMKTDVQDGDVSDNGKLKTSFGHIVRSGKTPEGAPQLPSGGKLVVDSLDHVGLNDNIAANVEDHNNADSCLEHELPPKAAPAHGNVEGASQLLIADNNDMLSEVQTDNGRLQNSEGSLDADGATNSGQELKLVKDISVTVHDGIKDPGLSVNRVLEVPYVKDGSDSGYLQAGKAIPKGNESDPSSPHASPQEEGNKDVKETSIQGTERRVECKGSEDIDKDIPLKPVEEDPSQIAANKEEGKGHAREIAIEGTEPGGEGKGSENINMDGNEKADEGNPSKVAISVASPTATLAKGDHCKSSPNVQSNSVRARKNRARQFEVGSNHTDCFQCIQTTDAESPGAPGTKAGHKKKKESISFAPQSVKASVKGCDGGALKQKGEHSPAALQVRDSQASMRQSKARKKGSVQHSTTISFGQGLEGREEWGKQVDVQTSKAAYLAPARVPDLNVAEAAISAQPFRESQQVQLRAQILVYGSLIQGGVPEEALMVAAFSDNNAAKRDQGNDSAAQGRVLWEKSWRLAAERINNRGVVNPPREPNQSAGASTLRTPDEAIPLTENTGAGPTVSPTDNRNPSASVTKGHSSRQKHSTESVTNKTSSKTSQPGTSTATRSLPPPSGETVSLQANRQPSDPQIASVRPFFSNPHVGPFVPGTTHWISPTPFPGPWMPQLPHAGFSSSVPFTLGQSDLIQEASATRKPAPSLPKSHVQGVAPVPGFSSPVMGPSSLPLNTAAADTGLLQKYGSMSNKPTPEARPRKRKKTEFEHQNVQRTGAASTLTWNSFEAANASGNLSSPPMYSSTETLAMVVANTSAVAAPTFNTFVPPLTSARNPTPNTTAEPQQSNRQGGYVLSETLMNHLEQAKANAEEASSLAASAVKESESMWSQLRAETDSGFICDTERQLVSSAIAMKTAAAVAKAAAAAARIAFEAAIQAKMMREEAMKSSEEQYASHSVGGATESCIQSGSEAGNNLPQAWKMPKACESALASAKMASKRSIETASSAMMRAQNLESVVRAAELATTAVSQVGALVAMGDSVPFKLDTLLEVGCEGLQSLVSPGISQDKVGYVKQITCKSQRREDSLEMSEKPASNKDESTVMLASMQEQVPSADQPSEHVTEGPVNARPKDSGNESRPDETSRGVEVIGHPNTDGEGSSLQNIEVMSLADVQKDATISPAEPAIEHQIVNNSIVEVLSDEEGLRGVWFSARVLKVDDRKALVLYDELISDDGPNRLEEWIGLEEAPDARPRVRLAHPNINVSFEGTRKRRREAIGQYTWSTGDQVDAWIHDGWWEGEIVDTLEEGEGKVKIYFPGEGDTQVIKTSKLRPSLVWKDGKWVLWTDIKELPQKGVESGFDVHKDDIPNAKRQKVENLPLSTDIRKPVAVSTRDDAVDPRSVEEGGEPFSNTSTKDASGKVSKVVIGVPKPTKRRKFIEVSKHFTSMKAAGSSLDGKGKGAAKHDEHAVVGMEFRMGSGETNKADGSKIKKRPPFSVQLKSRREVESTGIAEARSHVAKKQKDKPGLAESRMVVRRDGHVRGAASVSKGSESKSVKKTPAAGALIEPQRLIGNNPSSQPKEGTTRKTPVVRRYEVTESDPKMNSKESVKENETPSESLKGNEDQVGKKTLHKDDGKSNPEGCEPRRSVRRIQPTSKLLEGLQTAPKFGKSSFSSRQPLKVSTASKGPPSSP